MPLKSQLPDLILPNEACGKYYLNCFEKFGNSKAIVDADDNGRFYTFHELYQSSIKLASFLNDFGLKPKEVVGVCCENFIELPILMVGTMCCGAIYSPINPTYTEAEMVKLFEISLPKVVFTSQLMLPKLKKVAANVHTIKAIFCVDGNASDPNSFSHLLQIANSEYFPKDVKINPAEDVCVLPFSSGTTGLPKGVMLTNNYITAADALVRSTLNYLKSSVSLLNVPNFHIYGIMKYIMSFSVGSTIISCRKFTTLENMLSVIETYKVTDLSSVPPLLLGMANFPDLEKYDLSSVLGILSGAAPLPETVAKTITRRTGIEIGQGWGLTEFVPITLSVNKAVPITSVGVVAPNTILKVVDPETLQELGPNQKGELWAKGPQVMKGYYRNPSATSKCIDKDGYFHTGDIGYYDENQYVYIVDRLKELIKYKGFQVAPAELEEVLLQHEDILDVGVIGIPDEKAGQVPKAFIVKKRADLTAEQVHEFLKGRVSHYKYLRGGIKFCDSIPKSPSGKILRRLLLEADRLQKSKL